MVPYKSKRYWWAKSSQNNLLSLQAVVMKLGRDASSSVHDQRQKRRLDDFLVPGDKPGLGCVN